MSRFFRALIILVMVASCGSRSDNTAPRNLDNACSILTERPHYARAFRNTERRWGVPTHVQMAVIYQESKFKSRARTPYRYVLGVLPMGRVSSAYGYSQAIDGTWDEYRRAAGRWGAKRDDINDASDFMGWYMAGSKRSLGISLHDARNQYLAYHEGRTGYKRGTYRNKEWLLRVSGEVANRAQMYERQLSTCRRYRRA
ncbi:MAG: transglycosylase SLT domain-containing protein [Cognatishimia sp.]|jgi:hypothetical protein|uniref:transglycosylase SLT domain-containing protein n=1 Tax=Cognatishimia sp. TaxID=2211648 RepID=UPI004059F219